MLIFQTKCESINFSVHSETAEPCDPKQSDWLYDWSLCAINLKKSIVQSIAKLCVTEPCSQGFLGIIFSVSNECVDDMTKYRGTVYTVFQLLLFAVSSPIQELVFLLYPYCTVIFEWYTCTFSLPRLVPRSATACTVSYKGLESA